MKLKQTFLLILTLGMCSICYSQSVYETEGKVTKGKHDDGSTSLTQDLGDITILERYGMKGKFVRKGKLTEYTDPNGKVTVFHQIGKDSIYGTSSDGITTSIDKIDNTIVLKRSDGLTITCVRENDKKKTTTCTK